MAAPRKRVPGWVFVTVLVAVGVAVTIPLSMLRASTTVGPPMLLLLVDDTVTATPANATVPVDFGPFCSPIRWNDQVHALTIEADVGITGVDGVLLQQYRAAATNILWERGDGLVSRLRTAGEAWTITSPADGRTLATLTVAGQNVTMEGTTHASGSTWTAQFSYDVQTAGGTVHILEALTFRNLGVVTTHIVPQQDCG